jgi:twinkle protein
MSLVMDKPLHLPPVRETVDDGEFKAAFDLTFESDKFVFYDHFGSVESKTLLPKIRYMVLALGVKWVILDHISIMVSGHATEGDERKRIDELMTKLRSMVEELNFGLAVISHLRKANGTPHEEGGKISMNDLRGSGAIAQVSNMIIAAERNQQAEGEERNVTTLRVVKNRFSGDTGVAGTVSYNSKTGRIFEGPAVQGLKFCMGDADTQGRFPPFNLEDAGDF